MKKKLRKNLREWKKNRNFAVEKGEDCAGIGYQLAEKERVRLLTRSADTRFSFCVSIRQVV